MSNENKPGDGGKNNDFKASVRPWIIWLAILGFVAVVGHEGGETVGQAPQRLSLGELRYFWRRGLVENFLGRLLRFGVLGCINPGKRAVGGQLGLGVNPGIVKV